MHIHTCILHLSHSLQFDHKGKQWKYDMMYYANLLHTWICLYCSNPFSLQHNIHNGITLKASLKFTKKRKRKKILTITVKHFQITERQPFWFTHNSWVVNLRTIIFWRTSDSSLLTDYNTTPQSSFLHPTVFLCRTVLPPPP